MDTPDATDIADRLHSAAIHLLRRVRREDLQTGLSAARMSALSVIVFKEPISIGRLAEAEQVRSPTMSQIVDELVADGLVERVPSPEDARTTLVRTTPRGAELFHASRRRRVAILAAELASLPPEDLAALARAAEILFEVLDMTQFRPAGSFTASESTDRAARRSTPDSLTRGK
jgi:DNA-binding MarR family transcriptional regulator